MTDPTMVEVVQEMLDKLSTLVKQPPTPPPPAVLPRSNVTLERVAPKLAGLGQRRGEEQLLGLGTRALLAGRLEARVRFQLWDAGPAELDASMQTLHTDLLVDRDDLRAAGFLRLGVAETGLAEPVATFGTWRKVASVDVLYEYEIGGGDDADSLISMIHVTTDQPDGVGQGAGPGVGTGREQETIADEMVRWDDEAAPPLQLSGPRAVHRLSALAFVAGSPPAALGGAVTLRRTDQPGVPLIIQPDLASFLAVTGGPDPAEPNAILTLAPATLFAQIGATTQVLDLGDRDADAIPDEYAGYDRFVDPAIVLRGPADRFEISYRPAAPPPAGKTPALDRTAVVYLRVNQP